MNMQINDFAIIKEDSINDFQWVELSPQDICRQREYTALDVTCACFSPSGQHIAYGTATGDVFIWDFYTRTPVWELFFTEELQSACDVQDLGDIVRKMKRKRPASFPSSSVTCLCWENDNQHLIAAYRGGVIVIWHVTTQIIVSLYR